MPEKIYKATPTGDFGILESYVRAIRAAQRFIYLENQFLWSPEIASILAEKIAHPPTPDFRLLVVLPAKPNTGADDTRGVLGELLEADADKGRVFASTLYARSGPRADPIYVHAKLGDHRRRMAHDRLGKPERALPVQRHRDEHRHPRPDSRP